MGNMKPCHAFSPVLVEKFKSSQECLQSEKDHSDNKVRDRLDSVSASGQFDVVEANRLIVLSGVKNFEGFQIPVPSKIQIGKLRLYLKDYEDFEICDFLAGQLVIYPQIGLPLQLVITRER